MSNRQSASYIVSRNRGVPRGAYWAAQLFISAGNALSALTAPLKKGLQASAQARARVEILALADSYDRTQPAFAAELRAASAFADRDIDSKP